MLSDEPISISEAEWRVMEVLWDQAPLTAAEVIKALEGEVDWHPRTIKTLLHRLVKKGVLTFERQGNRYRYLPSVERDPCVRQVSDSFLKRVFRGEAMPMLMHFVRNSQLSHEEMRRLKQLIDEVEDTG